MRAARTCFLSLKPKGLISQKELQYFTYEFKKSTNLRKLYLLPKINKSLSAVYGWPVISNYGTPTGKASEFVEFHLKSIMQGGGPVSGIQVTFLTKSKVSTVYLTTQF